MSATLYALIIAQGSSGLAFQPGYATKEECQAVYQGPTLSAGNTILASQLGRRFLGPPKALPVPRVSALFGDFQMKVYAGITSTL